MTVLLGAVADDFTGATDLANTLRKEGMRVVQTIGAPEGDAPEGADAVVVALKSRTAPKTEAVASSLAALEWLRAAGSEQIIFKYCSTFDSTAEGNIGPVADAMIEALGGEIAVVCPAFPGAGRTIYQGKLFVHDQLLSESSMWDHPLTPMRDSDLRRLMRAQSRHEVGLIDLATVRRGAEAIAEARARLAAQGARYAVVDALTDDDLRRIGRASHDQPLLTGGSGVALGVPENFRAAGRLEVARSAKGQDAGGRAAVLAGSCSSATRGQIAYARQRMPHLKISLDALADDAAKVVADALDWAGREGGDGPVLIYGSADPDEVAANQAKFGRERAGDMLEAALGAIAEGLVAGGVQRMVVAGGETSGAVVTALGVEALKIGAEIDPGVPWTETVALKDGASGLSLALKSGNFGRESFFEHAFSALEGGDDAQ